MDGLLVAAFVLAAVGAIAWVFTIIATCFALWQWVYLPWKVMRADIVALNREMGELRQQARVKIMSDEEVAHVEARMNARERVRRGVQ